MIASESELDRAVYEIWTKRSIYEIDASMRCVRVTNRASGELAEGHRCIGARVGGGRRFDGNELTVTYPLPVPGARALFQEGEDDDERVSMTSDVQRVIVRTRDGRVEGQKSVTRKLSN